MIGPKGPDTGLGYDAWLLLYAGWLGCLSSTSNLFLCAMFTLVTCRFLGAPASSATGVGMSTSGALQCCAHSAFFMFAVARTAVQAPASRHLMLLVRMSLVAFFEGFLLGFLMGLIDLGLAWGSLCCSLGVHVCCICAYCLHHPWLHTA